MTLTYKQVYENERAKFEDYLTKYLDSLTDIPEPVLSGMKYAVGSGGKRLRPMLAILTAKLFNKEVSTVYPIATAVELIHNYSLVHDDLPCMDNDELRRGMPTVHVKYGEGMAVLIGDALLNTAVEVLAEGAHLWREKLASIILTVFKNAGASGMIAGQCVDLASEHDSQAVTPERVNYLHLHKTACLIEAPVLSSAIACGASCEELKNLKTYAQNLGLAFQITDDILDIEGDEATFGKPIGSDEANEKLTYPRVYGLLESKKLARECILNACASLEGFSNSEYLNELAKSIENRIK